MLPKLFNVAKMQKLNKPLLQSLESIETDDTLLPLESSEQKCTKKKIKKILEKLDVHIESTIERSVSQQFWFRIFNALVLTSYIASLGTSLSRNDYINLVGDTFMVCVANFLIIYSVCKIKGAINKLRLVFLQERYLDAHLMTFILHSLVFLAI